VSIEILVNGEKIETEHHRLSLFIESRQMDEARFAVAVNQQFIPKAAYDSVELAAGDELELVVPMQGG